jgi:hypothetical protein
VPLTIRHAKEALGYAHIYATYPRAMPGALKYADNCRFGHTFRGSFGFTIESPIEENLSSTDAIYGSGTPV